MNHPSSPPQMIITFQSILKFICCWRSSESNDQTDKYRKLLQTHLFHFRSSPSCPPTRINMSNGKEELLLVTIIGDAVVEKHSGMTDKGRHFSHSLPTGMNSLSSIFLHYHLSLSPLLINNERRHLEFSPMFLDAWIAFHYSISKRPVDISPPHSRSD